MENNTCTEILFFFIQHTSSSEQFREKSVLIVNTILLLFVPKYRAFPGPHPWEIRAHLKGNGRWTRRNHDIFPSHAGECHNFLLTSKSMDPFLAWFNKRTLSGPQNTISVSNISQTTWAKICKHSCYKQLSSSSLHDAIPNTVRDDRAVFYQLVTSFQVSI